MLTKVGKYEIIEKVGVGGFGTVYRGRDPYIKRTVAIKTCQSDEDELRKRFFREAEFAGNLHHRNITTIYDFGLTEEGLPYIVQEFLTGEDLDRKIKRKDDLSLAWRVRVLADICDGLHYAHTSGIVHRDVKPSNIRILEDGTVKIMDFGIAKSMVTESTLTQTGITLGTASYLAPEQIRGEPVDARTDIFSLGVLAYELFTYTRPFTGDHISTVLYKIMNEHPPSPAEVVAGLPPALVAVIEKTLEKDRSNRFASCAELKESLMAVLEVVSGPVGAPPRSASGEEPLPSGPRTFGSARLDERLLVVPNRPSAAADLQLRPEPPSTATPAPLAPRPEETGSALKVFLGALAILVVVGGGLGWLLLGPGAKKLAPAGGAAEPSATTVPVATPIPESTVPATPPTSDGRSDCRSDGRADGGRDRHGRRLVEHLCPALDRRRAARQRLQGEELHPFARPARRLLRERRLRPDQGPVRGEGRRERPGPRGLPPARAALDLRQPRRRRRGDPRGRCRRRAGAGMLPSRRRSPKEPGASRRACRASRRRRSRSRSSNRTKPTSSSCSGESSSSP